MGVFGIKFLKKLYAKPPRLSSYWLLVIGYWLKKKSFNLVSGIGYRVIGDL